jgi:hypothetical protein
VKLAQEDRQVLTVLRAPKVRKARLVPQVQQVLMEHLVLTVLLAPKDKRVKLEQRVRKVKLAQ